MSDKYGRNESSDIIDDLNSIKPEKQKEAVKKIISAMTIGRDVSKLFPQIVKCIETHDNELKKLVYLYIINYARIRPIETLLAVNSFKKDSSDRNPNPLMRALAVRTMGCLGVEEVMQFLCDPLKDALKDKDPYVRKTAVICVAKIYDVHPNLVEEQFCFIDVLQNFIENEGNSMVVANSVASLIEMSNSKGTDLLKMTWRKCKCLLTALHENNEWCQIYLLEAISRYLPQNQEEVTELIERIVPLVSHSNSAVVLTSIKILIKLLDLVQIPDTIRSVCKKITPSLVTLLSSEKEIQYVALKNINILIQKRPIIFEKDIKMFFCNFSEPIYNKMEKLEIIYKLVSMNNIDLVLNELKEYSSEVDVQFVKRSVRLIGQCAIKLEKAAERCVEALVELVKSQISYVIQESIISLRDIFRRYPNQYEGAMQIVNENLKTLDDPTAKSALIWIIGEYSDRIDGAEMQLTKFLDNLKEETYEVQLQLLTASIKTYLKVQSEQSFEILNSIFEFTNTQTDNSDLRERGYIYYRLLELDPNIACAIILSEKPRISEELSSFDSSLLDKLVDNLGTLASVYVKPPESFVKKSKKINVGEEEEVDYEENQFNLEEKVTYKEDKKVVKNEEKQQEAQQQAPEQPIPTQSFNLLDLDSSSTDFQPQQSQQYNNQTQANTNNIKVMNNNSIFESMSMMSISDNQPTVPAKNPANIPLKNVLDADIPGSSSGATGLVIEASVQRDSSLSCLFLRFLVTNRSDMVLNGFEIQLNTNYYGISCMSNGLSGLSIHPGCSEECKLDLFTNISCDLNKLPNTDSVYLLQAGIRCNLDEYFFKIPVMFCVLFESDKTNLSMEEFIEIWQSLPKRQDMCCNLEGMHPNYHNSTEIIKRFDNNNIFLIDRKEVNGQEQIFFNAKLTNGQVVCISAAYSANSPADIAIIVKMQEMGELNVINLIIQSLRFLLKSSS